LYEEYGVPTLDLVFTQPNNGLLNIVDNGQIAVEFTRTQDTPSSYIKSDGIIGYAATDVPRFDHDPVTGESLGLLIEESRTNFLTYSVDFSQQFTGYGCSFTANTTVAPDGTITATTLIEDTANNSHLLSGYTGIPQAGNGTHTFSCFAKAKERSVIALSTNQAIGKHAAATFDLQGGVVSQYGGTNDGDVDYVDSSITHIGNGWYRCSLTYTKTIGDVWPNIEIVDTPTYTYTNYGRRNYQGDGTSGVYVWGVQFEQNSSFPTSYIPTSGSTSTRGADLGQITGVGFSSFYNQSEGTFMLGTKVNALTDSRFFNVYGTTGTFYNADLKTNGDVQWTPTVSGATAGIVTVGQPSKIAYKYGPDKFRTCLNGGPVAVKQSGDAGFVPQPQNRIYFSLGNPGYLPANHHMTRFTYWPTALPDSDLQSLTE
jgi:hypothetical protein